MENIIEALKVIAPIGSAIFIAVYVNRTNEGVKAELTKKLNSFQIRDSTLHQRRLDVIEKIYELIIKCVSPLQGACLYSKGSALYEFNEPEKLDRIRTEKILEYFKTRGELSAYYTAKKIFLDESTCEDIDAVLEVLNAAAGPLNQEDFLDEMIKGSPQKERNRLTLRNWFLETQKVLPALEGKLTDRMRKLVAPESK